MTDVLPETIRVLLVEDSEADAELIVHELLRSGFDVASERVHSLDSLERALDDPWDAVIADDALPGFSAARTVELVARRAPATPTIVVSGVLREETAAEIFHLGARDFVAKQNLARLAPVLRRELQDVDRRREHLEAERAFAAIFAGAIDAMVLTDEDGRYLQVNPAACELYGRPRAELLGARVGDLLERGILRSTVTWTAFVSAGESEGEVEVIRPDGEIRIAEFRATMDVLPGRHMSVLRDVTERRRADEELRASRELYEVVVDNSTDVIVLLDLEGTIVFHSPAAARVLGWDESARGRKALDFIHPEDVESTGAAFVRAAERGEAVSTVARIEVGDDSWMTLEGTFTSVRDGVDEPTMMLVTARDVTDRERARALEAQLQQAQKMEAVGRLAGGVAHDFNNLLMAIIGYCELSLAPSSNPEKVQSSIREIRAAADRGASLTKQLLAFSHLQVLARETLDVNDVVGEYAPMLARLLGEDLLVEVNPGRDLGSVVADRGQLGQVIVNLAVNARDAMPAGGVLSIATRAARLPDGGDGVAIAIRDTGCGIPDEIRGRVFEPFFTTKPVGEGTGLGLATVLGIVEQSGGTIELESTPGEGSTFTVVLPRSDEPGPESNVTVPAAEASGGSERILVVEDEQMVRDIVEEALLEKGYAVSAVAGPEEALRRAEQDRFDLLLTDLVMPRMSGRELADLLAETQPDLRVVFMSGYTDDDVLKRGVQSGTSAFLQKPFSLGQLAQRVRAVLD